MPTPEFAAAGRRILTALGLAALLAAGMLGALPAAASDAGTGRFRVSFSPGMFTEVNLSDARAAVRVWGQTIAKERGIDTDPDTSIFKDFEEMSRALQANLTDAVGMTVVEYEKLHRDTLLSPLFFTLVGGTPAEQYLLLVHSESGIDAIGKLQGRGLLLLSNVRSCVAAAWLGTLLVQKGLRPAADFFGSVTSATKPSQAALPVFFRKADACVLTRSAYATLCELNPQIEKKLKILESSTELVPAVFALRGDYDPPFKDQLLNALQNLHETPAGQQVLTVFLADRLEQRPASALQSAMDIIQRHRTQAGSPAKAAAAAQALAIKEKERRTP
jgi:ABC-type phosphate/phosphonate transport system substrate-binding protein